MNLELDVWGNGEVCLTFWDSIHGHDIVFVLNGDGSATVDSKKIDLVTELRRLAQPATGGLQ